MILYRAAHGLNMGPRPDFPKRADMPLPGFWSDYNKYYLICKYFCNIFLHILVTFVPGNAGFARQLLKSRRNCIKNPAICGVFTIYKSYDFVHPAHGERQTATNAAAPRADAGKTHV